MQIATKQLWADPRHPGVGADVPKLRARTAREHADGCVSVFLRMYAVQNVAKAEGRRLLRVLFLRIGRLSAHPRATQLLQSALRPWFSSQVMLRNKRRFAIFGPDQRYSA
jgi:hypothetical protein